MLCRLSLVLLMGWASSSVVSAAQLDWDAVSWPNGNLTRTYNGIGNGDISITITGETSGLDATSCGGQCPGIHDTLTGGLSPEQDTWHVGTDYGVGAADELTITMDFTHANGVTNLAFSIFDIDADSNWIDELVITATDGVSTFNPTSVTSSSCTSFNGTNTITGTCRADNDTNDGTSRITFAQSGIIQITMLYRNTLPDPDPGQQFIAYHDNDFDEEPLALTKRAFELDGTPIASGSTLPAGTSVRFLIYLNNRGAARSDVSVRDGLAAGFSYDASTLRVDNSIAACGAATCNATEEATVLTAVSSATLLTDGVDGDVGSVSGGVVDVGNSTVANGQANILATRVWSVTFTATLQ